MVPSEGVVIHTIDCDVLDRHQDSMADWIDVRWKEHVDALSVARIMVRLKNTPGALATIANVIGQNGANISNLKITSRNPLFFEFQVDVEVRDAAHLENLIRALKVDSAVEAVERYRGLDTDNQAATRRERSFRARCRSSGRSIRPMSRLRLGVNIDHVATLRNARGSPLSRSRCARRRPRWRPARTSSRAHLREDRRHIQRQRRRGIRCAPAVPLNLEMGATEEMAGYCRAAKTAGLLHRARAARGSDAPSTVSTRRGTHNRVAPLVAALERRGHPGLALHRRRRRANSRPRVRLPCPMSSCTPAPMPKPCSKATATTLPATLKL